MQPPHPHSRVNLAEMRAQICKKLGPERSKQYFYYLSRLLSLKINKVQFNRLCCKVLGRENVSMHNQFINSILKNACHGNIPPSRPTSDEEILNCTNALPLTPQKLGSDIGTRTIGKVDFPSHNSMITSDIVNLENGDFHSPRIQESMQHHQVLSEQTNYKGKVLLHQPDNLLLIKAYTDGVASGNRRHHHCNESLVKHGKGVSFRNVLGAPIGIPFCSVSVGGTRKTLPSARNDRFANSIDKGRLPDIGTFRERMQQIAIAQGLKGASKDCANLLHDGLDSYLRRLIKSCIDLVEAKSRPDMVNCTDKHHREIVDDVSPGRHFRMQSSSRTSEGVVVDRPSCPITLLDFKVAMELNPHQLGKDWSLLLERICTHSFVE